VQLRRVAVLVRVPRRGGGAAVKVWGEVQPSGGDFSFAPGARYAVLASASTGFTLEQIVGYAEGHGFAVTYSWETGQGSRATYQIDNWLDGLPPDTASGQRWIYLEANRTAADGLTVAQDPSWALGIVGVHYHISHVFQAVDAPDPVTPADTPAAPALPSSSSSSSSSGSDWGYWPLAIALIAVGVGWGVWDLRHYQKVRI